MFIGGLLSGCYAHRGHAAQLMTPFDARVLARTVYGEASIESVLGQTAIAHVVFNRVRSKDRLFQHDRTVTLACLRPGQFSCWRSPWHLERLSLHSSPGADIYSTVWEAYRMYENGIDVTYGATHYLRTDMQTEWSRDARVTTRIGAHTFYSNVR